MVFPPFRKTQGNPETCPLEFAGLVLVPMWKMFFWSYGPAAVAGEDGLDGFEEVLGGELTIGLAAGPVGFQAEAVTILEPEGALLDAGLLKIIWKRAWPGPGVVPGRTYPPV